MPSAPHGMVVPWLVLAVGNPSRGDDALGPELIERLSLAESAASDVEFLIDFQLQVEHALDLKGRHGVLFVDAARPGVVARCRPSNSASVADIHGKPDGVIIVSIAADDQVPPASHALKAEAVLHVARQLDGEVPPAWQLAIEGHSFGLGEELSEVAEQHLNHAIDLAQEWLNARRASVARALSRE